MRKRTSFGPSHALYLGEDLAFVYFILSTAKYFSASLRKKDLDPSPNLFASQQPLHLLRLPSLLFKEADGEHCSPLTLLSLLEVLKFFGDSLTLLNLRELLKLLVAH